MSEYFLGIICNKILVKLTASRHSRCDISKVKKIPGKLYPQTSSLFDKVKGVVKHNDNATTAK